MTEFMIETTLREALFLWWAGHSLGDRALWGMPILWWGRIGKAVQLVGGLTIVVEIIGPKRLRGFGNSLHGAITFRTLRRQFANSWRLATNSVVFLVTWGERSQKALDNVTGSPLAWLDATLAVWIAVVLIFVLCSRVGWSGVVIGACLGAVSYVTVSPFLAALLAASVSGLGLVIDSFFVEPLAWFVERPHIDRLVKLFGLGLLVIGSCLDLLAS